MNPGDTYESHQDGPFKIVENNGWNKMIVEFPSGWKIEVCRQQIRQGKVKDRYKKNYCGIGYIGGNEYKAKGPKSEAIHRWKHMIARCYDPNHKNYKNYGGKGVIVCEEWHNYQNYAKWYYENKIPGYQIDKDILSGESKIYSPETCKFVSNQENVEYSQSKWFLVTSPEGKEERIKNLCKFCREKGLFHSLMHKVARGERNHHQGWKCKKLQTEENK